MDKKKKVGFSLLMEWADRNRVYVYISVVLALISSLSSIVPYLIFYKLIDALVERRFTFKMAITMAGILVAITLVRVICNMFASISSHKGAYNTLFRVRCMVTGHMAKMPLGALNERSTGEIKYVLNESIEKMELFLAHNLVELVLYASGPVVMFIYLVSVNVKLGLISILPLIPVIVVMMAMFMRFGKFMDAVNSSSGDLSGSVSEYVNGMRLIKAYNMSVQSFRKYSDAIEKQFNLWCAISKATGPFYAAYIVLLESGILMLVPAGGYMFVHGHITAGVLLLFAFIGSQYLMDIRPLQELSNNLAFVLNGIKQVEDILDTKVFEGDEHFPENCHIKLKDVNFSYDKKNNVLQNVNLEIKNGEKIAVIGKSGAGKSTLVQLISRFYDVEEGEILIGDKNIKKINYEELLDKIAIVFQNSFLTGGSVYENIAMGRNVSYEEVRKAARKACIDDFIINLPQGYDTLCNGYGTRFSGGQKQRICIARAILKNAPILILDEATSAADPENQIEIDKAIDNLCKEKTVIIVAHRLDIVKKCDRIVVVENQGISAVGTFEKLLKTNEYFSNAWQQYTRARNTKYRLGDNE
ncbi:ATP-binding cassette, subfamily B [Acetitomaculum ruminis DSM 5522]|uniref:ATP-binding cassette, subfamily B n=1 Tax=Acetitomaculum ruminis DSM 5522 TaxID=1120918 RepID=A0A1I0Y2U5_9FIRM|nr:ABC transporter ATP-binding protein [Acetitomaculum ruminis]SFB07689.1 ATP-binding cassette, subfamily B [Acetitomaculum ruminis DSM 5522]